MKLYARSKNEKGKIEGVGDNIRILTELTYKNKIIGTVGLYAITHEGKDLGYRVVWDDGKGWKADNVIAEYEQGQKLQGKYCNECMATPCHQQ